VSGKLVFLIKLKLSRLAEDLNSTPTHFVLECIQNADDNRYEQVDPFLRISVFQDRIRMDCNEKGFDLRDVKAICSVGESTKGSRQSGRRGYIGEKGIGFKSVFKVAEVVHIYSHPYYFKFDKREELGMITPIWVPEEQRLAVASGDIQTTILLLPPQGTSFEPHFGGFWAVSPTLLLFLNKLKAMELSLWNSNFGAVQQPTKSKLMTKLEEGSYATLRVQNPDETVPDTRYRLFNLIQADLLLTASREDVDAFTTWNKVLRRLIEETFKKAMVEFTRASDDQFRYSWIKFLPGGINHPFWKQAEVGIKADMRHTEIIESRAGSLHKPTDLRFLESWEVDRHGNPLVGNPSEFLSKRYAERRISSITLRTLGVQESSWRWLLVRLLGIRDYALQAKSSWWHEDMAECLLKAHRENALHAYLPNIRTKTFIPLQDGTWTSAQDLSSRPIYFREGVNNVYVPSDISLRLVESGASANSSRKEFFKLLGVIECDAQQVARLILAGDPPGLANAIVHAQYLYELDPSVLCNLNLSGLWLYNHQGVPAKGCDLYIHDTTSPYSPAILFANTEHARYLSPDYSNCPAAIANRQRWMQWLMRTTGLTDFPRLQKHETVTPEFKFILQHHPHDVLYILEQNWASYRYQINAAIRHMISHHIVLCSDDVNDRWEPLNRTFAPAADLKELGRELCNGSNVYLLKIENYGRPGWDFLQEFGVGLEADISFYIWLAQQIQFRENCTLQSAKSLLQRMAQLTGMEVQRQRQV
jgi:hypothetical protein